MNKITVLKFDIEDELKPYANPIKNIDLNKFSVLRRVQEHSVEITDEEIEKLLYGEHMEINAAKDFNKGVLSCWNYIKLRINQ